MLPDAMTGSKEITFCLSQCTYRCVVLPDTRILGIEMSYVRVSMHLQVRGAP